MDHLIRPLRAVAEGGSADINLLAKRAADELERLQEMLRSTGANRYWEGRWRDEYAENERLRAFHEAWVEAQVAMATGNRELAESKRAAMIAAHKAVRANEQKAIEP